MDTMEDNTLCIKNEYTGRCATHYHSENSPCVKKELHICERDKHTCFGIYIVKSNVTLKGKCKFAQFEGSRGNSYSPICEYCKKKLDHLDSYFHIWGCYYCCKKLNDKGQGIITCESCIENLLLKIN